MSCDQELQKWSWTYQIGAYMYKNGVAPPLSTQSTGPFHGMKEAAEEKGGGGASEKKPSERKVVQENICVLFF